MYKKGAMSVAQPRQRRGRIVHRMRPPQGASGALLEVFRLVDWAALIKRLDASVQARGKPAVCWVITGGRAETGRLTRELKQHLAYEYFQSLLGLVYIPGRLSVFFYSEPSLRKAPACPLDGVLLLKSLPEVHLDRLRYRLAMNDGWLIDLTEESKGVCCSDPSQ